MASFGARLRAFLKGWGRDLALAGGGALCGLVLALAVDTGGTAPAVQRPALKPAVYTPPAASPPAVQPARRAAAPASIPHGAAASELPPWRRFAALHPVEEGRPSIAVIIDDMGVDHGRSARALRLPAAVTLSFLPYARDVTRQATEAGRRGHEIMLHLPMEPDGGADPGPDVLRTDEPPEWLVAQFDRALRRIPRSVGFNNHMGSRFTADPASMRVILEAARRRGLLFIDSRTTTKTVGARLAQNLGVPSGRRDVFLDDDPTHAAILAQLRRLEKLARRRGYAVAIGHPRDATLDVLEGWVWGLKRRGFVLVPVSAIVGRRRQAG